MSVEADTLPRRSDWADDLFPYPSTEEVAFDQGTCAELGKIDFVGEEQALKREVIRRGGEMILRCDRCAPIVESTTYWLHTTRYGDAARAAAMMLDRNNHWRHSLPPSYARSIAAVLPPLARVGLERQAALGGESLGE
jgi:hypothetical protein